MTKWAHRALVRVAAVLSVLLLCVYAVSFWYYPVYETPISRAGTQGRATLINGSLWLASHKLWSPELSAGQDLYFVPYNFAEPPESATLWITSVWRGGSTMSTHTARGLPLWPAVVISLGVLTFQVIHLLRRSRIGRCLCGYSLTGLTTNTCPECGRTLKNPCTSSPPNA